VAAIVRAIEAARELGHQHAFDSVRDSDSFQGPGRAPRRSGNWPDLPRRVSGTPLARAKLAWTSSPWSTRSFAYTALWVYAWPTPP
jgi:hypothetical protein